MSGLTLDISLKLLTPFLVVGGWVVVYRLQALQARRKLLRETAEKVRDSVSALLADAINFHTKEFDAEKKIAITLALTHLEKRYQLFPQIAGGNNSCFPAVDPKQVAIDAQFMVELRQAITLVHFDEPEQPLTQTSAQIQRITSSAVALIGEIDRVIVAALD